VDGNPPMQEQPYNERCSIEEGRQDEDMRGIRCSVVVHRDSRRGGGLQPFLQRFPQVVLTPEIRHVFHQGR
jgi:hypothetical protein